MSTDPDLPGDEAFRPLPPIVTTIIDTPGGPAWAMKQTISPIEQANLQHNLTRYGELQKLRRGQPNLYKESRYHS